MGESEYFRIPGTSKNISELENNIFKACGVRVIIRTPAHWEMFVKAEKALQGKLRLGASTAVWKKHILDVLNGKLTIGQRGFDHKVELKARDIVFVSPKGIAVHGMTLAKNIVFTPKTRRKAA